ncbi:response regulator [Alsobacter metallidurans]|uniref:Response regulator n=1 Tax=Alsobacter metallidurans TaxID=340221 RepID=A0A917MG71_9HYPH|nr:response regulator [Alsobacter metallidurans]GGH06887.1 response regulator [Alsobacter metallidurans]
MPLDRSSPVLVIDDSQIMTNILRRLLQQAGFRDVDVAVGAQAGLNRVAERGYGLVVCDWLMPPYTGADVKNAMARRAQLAAIPVLLITAQAKSHDVYGNALGPMIVKPFNAETLAARIDSLVDSEAA